ncbi:MAG: hypothetical protein ABEI99_06330, partial [Halobaculum sp.]
GTGTNGGTRMALRQYAVVMALGILIGGVVGGVVVATDLTPIETVDDVLGGEDELAGVGTPSDIGGGTTDGGDGGDGGTPQDSGTATATDTATAASTATATESGDTGGTGGTSGTDTPASTPTETASSGTTDTATSTATVTGDAFSFAIQEITECGDTCRDITAAVTNEQSTEASDVTTFTQIYAGNETTSDAKIYENRQSVGAIPAGETATTTQRVEFTLTEAVKIRDNGGWITIVTKITDADGDTVTVTQRRDVT